jgi:hypothetical protein
MASQLPGRAGKTKSKQRARGHGGLAAQAVNLDTKTYIDHKGRAQQMDVDNRPLVDGLTTIFHGADAGRPFHEHARDNSKSHKHVKKHSRLTPHPNDVMEQAMEGNGSLPGRAA